MLQNNSLHIKKFNLYTYIIITLCVSGCSTGVEQETENVIEGPLTRIGLEQVEVNAINNETENMLVLTNDGVYIREDKKITSFGLRGKPVIDIAHLGGGEYLAGVFTNCLSCGDQTLYKKSNGDWIKYMKDYGGEEGKYTKVTGLANHPINGIIYASGGANVSKSSNEGNNWEIIFRTWDSIASTYFLELNKEHPDTLWMGGMNNIGGPTLDRSIDGGKTWEFINTLEFGSLGNYDILFDYTNNKHITISLYGLLRSTVDFGESWETVLAAPYAFETFAQSSVTAGKVYVSGSSPEEEFFLFVSYDYGYNWEEIVFEDAPENMEVNDMVSVQEEGKEILYLGTNRGLFTYEVES